MRITLRPMSRCRLATAPCEPYFIFVSTVQEIREAIQTLSAEERHELARSLPALLPELDGDAAWERILHDPRPRPAFSALVDEIEAEFKRNPDAFPEIQDGDFESHR